jgi:sterol desaturase/sphingolipid hydroxylase (fatty acid hydroxylase superfamily)
MLIELALIAYLYLIFGIFEVTVPAEHGQSRRGRLRNIGYLLMLMLSGIVFTSIIYLLIPLPIRQLPDRGLGYSLLMVLVYVFLKDILFYVYHRAQHRFNPLWRIHELHHSDTELNVTTSTRSYWLERPIQTLLIAIPLGYVIGLDNRAALILPFVLTGWLFFGHANWRLSLGILTPVIVGPQYHRIHHSRLPEHRNKNLAQYFPVIDIMFGTYHAPARNEFPPTGTSGLATDTSIPHTLLRPFRGWKQDILELLRPSQ